jgi:hypothetical protein
MTIAEEEAAWKAAWPARRQAHRDRIAVDRRVMRFLDQSEEEWQAGADADHAAWPASGEADFYEAYLHRMAAAGKPELLARYIQRSAA